MSGESSLEREIMAMDLKGVVRSLMKKMDVVLSVKSLRFRELRDIRNLMEEMMTQLMYDQIWARIIWESEGVRVVRLLTDIIDKFGDLHDKSEDSVSGHPKKLSRCMKLVRRIRASSELNFIRLQLQDSLYEMKMGMNEHTTEVRDDAIYIGMDKNITTLINWLTKDEETNCRAIAVQGIGGMGKTALTRQVYNHQEVRKKFEFRAWITVSLTNSIDDILESIYSQFSLQERQTPVKGDRRDQIRMIHDRMQQERCVIIFDDVWSVDDWDDIHHIFPVSMCRSKILYTTRDFNLTLKPASQDFVLNLPPLKEEEAWALFCRRSFSRRRFTKIGGIFLGELKEFARNLVKKCDGLPLAICVLSGKVPLDGYVSLEWRNLLHEFKSSVADDKSIKNILKLSLDNLPYRLKNSFLYCSAFPEDFSMSKMRLVRSWVAEEFVEARNGVTLEEVAESYFDELILLGLLQVAEKDHTNGIIACKMNCIIRHLAVTISREEKFFVSYIGKDDEKYLDDKIPRLSLHNFLNDVLNMMNRIINLHTLMVFAGNQIHQLALEKLIQSSFRSLRVLDLEGVSIEILPNAVGNLRNLRFLNLRGTSIKVLPSCIGRLLSLQTLDLTDTEVVKLPDEIVSLKNLRHLLAFYDHYGGITVPETIGNCQDLQSLEGVEASDEVIKKVGNLTQLRSLTIVNVGPSHGAELGTSLAKMNRLVTLVIYSVISGDYMIQLAALSPPKNLQKLTLRGRLEGLPCSFGSLVNLTHLYLFQSQLTENPLPTLQSLPKLEHLTLTGAASLVWLPCEPHTSVPIPVLVRRRPTPFPSVLTQVGTSYSYRGF
ncbi:Disease resistance protein RPM1 [Acorus calamus]|uniref:Disease resistance protein RPM1 n=1 Tax=Acorus calamus TaxID=4465 RepID=A0AAV9D790_ACOCL|nr:Disease resistance protein RPM1 [Acorus calamus]